MPSKPKISADFDIEEISISEWNNVDGYIFWLMRKMGKIFRPRKNYKKIYFKIKVEEEDSMPIFVYILVLLVSFASVSVICYGILRAYEEPNVV